MQGIVAVFLALCNGDGKGNVNMECVDYYNNCIVNKSDKLTDKVVNECKKELKSKGISFKLNK